jgi:DNA repair exonuclease SbcCD ATPase subunit
LFEDSDHLPQTAAVEMPNVANSLRAPGEARRRIARLISKREDRVDRSRQLAFQFEKLNRYLTVAGQVTAALDQLSKQLFQELLLIVQEKLTIALQEILDQPIHFRAEADFQRGAASVDFWVERDGKAEDVLKGQGGSVANILSVGLRMFALATLDSQRHRPFLVLDEQDCWLRPDLVPRLVKIVHQAAQELGFQVIMISHHDVALFERYADKIFEFIPGPPGTVKVREVAPQAAHADGPA